MQSYKAYIFDLDGTLYVGDRPVPGAAETIQAIRQSGARLLFFTNGSLMPPSFSATKLTRMGIPSAPDEVLTSAVVTARYLAREAPGARIYLIGEPPLAAELRNNGLRITRRPAMADYVLVSWDRTFTYRKLAGALTAIRNGARFIATHADRTCPTDQGEIPDAGGMVGAVEAVVGEPVQLVVGKPSSIAVHEALRMVGLTAADCLMVGDRLETDIRMGVEAGMATALVLTGATRREQLAQTPWQPNYVLDSVADLSPPILSRQSEGKIG